MVNIQQGTFSGGALHFSGGGTAPKCPPLATGLAGEPSPPRKKKKEKRKKKRKKRGKRKKKKKKKEREL